MKTDDILAEHFALDYHCAPEDFGNCDPLVTEYAFRPCGRGWRPPLPS